MWRSALLVLAACASGSAWETEVDPLLATRCVGCHVGDYAGGGLELSGDRHAALVDVASSQVPAMKLVEPGDSLHSYLFHKVNGSQAIAGGAGTTMPIGSPLDEDEIALIEAWIDDGAAP